MGKLFAVVHDQGFDPCTQGLENILNGLADQLRTLVGHLDDFGKAALAFNQGHNGLLVSRVNDGIALPVTYLFVISDMARTLTGISMSI